MPAKNNYRSTIPVGNEAVLRREFIKELGLREGATSGDILRAKNERYLFQKIEQYGLGPNATWQDVLKAEASYITSTRIPS